jgi:hypothetical protein
MQLVMLKCVGVLDVVQAHELINVRGYGSTHLLKTKFHESCEWVFVILEIAKIMTSGLIEREIRVS